MLRRHCLMLALTALLFGLVAGFVDLKPQVQADFFFSSKDPEYRQTAKIDKIFPSGSQLIVNVASPQISSDRYLERLAQFTRELQSVKIVTSVQSLADGPKNFEDAEKSPFWRRLLIAENGCSSNVIPFASDQDMQGLISRIEEISKKFDAKDFRIQIAGAPYIAEMLRRSLQHDFRVFSLTSFLLFGAAMWVLFRSWKLTVGILDERIGPCPTAYRRRQLAGQPAMTAILSRRLGVHPCLGRRNLLVLLCLYQRKQPPNLLVRDQSASAPMNRSTLGLIVVGSGILFVVARHLSPRPN